MFSEVETIVSHPGAPFVASDAWILHAILVACHGHREPADRERIIGAADWIMHAIPDDNELEGALQRLAAGDYIVQHGDDRFSPAPRVSDWYERLVATGWNLLGHYDDVKRYLGVTG